MITALGLTNKGGNWINGEGWSGNGYHRILMPLSTMNGVKGFVSDAIEQDSKLDILLYNRMSQYDGNWDKVKEDIGCKVVIDLDDYWYPDYYQTAKRIINNIKKADLVIVVNEFLKTKALELNDNVVVVENGLPFGRWQFTEDVIASDKVRIFWSGGLNHAPDLELFKNAVNYKNKMLVHKDDVIMVMAGFNSNKMSEAICKRMLFHFSLEGKMNHAAVNTMPATSYMDAYKHADIMVIPLAETIGNKGKSILKILEAASRKVPVIVSNVEPYSLYKGAPVLRVNEKRDWFRHIDYLIRNPSERVRLGNAVHDWAVKNYSLEDMNEKRLVAFQNTLAAK